MANIAATAAAAGPALVEVDVVSATVIDRQIVLAGTKNVPMTEVVARRLLERGKVVLSEGAELPVSDRLVSMGALPSDADGDGVLDAGGALLGDDGKGGPPVLGGEAPGSTKFDVVDPPVAPALKVTQSDSAAEKKAAQEAEKEQAALREMAERAAEKAREDAAIEAAKAQVLADEAAAEKARLEEAAKAEAEKQEKAAKAEAARKAKDAKAAAKAS